MAIRKKTTIRAAAKGRKKQRAAPVRKAASPPKRKVVAKAKAPTRRKPFRMKSPRVSIVVSQELITTAMRADSSHCMIAEGIRVAVPGAMNISVDLQSIRWTDPAKRLRYTYLTPRVAQVELIKFDQGIMSEPFTFELKRAAQITRSGFNKKDPKAGTPITSKKELSAHGRVAANKAKAQVSNSLGRKRAQHEHAGQVATVIGGNPPPRGNLAFPSVPASAPGNMARFRTFGLRQLRG